MNRKRWITLVLSLLLTLSMLTGCDNYDDLLANLRKNDLDISDGMISGIRSGILRQGISSSFKTSDCSDEFVWFFADMGGLPMLYRLKHDSDVLEPLCSLPNCSHSDSSCGAFYPSGGNVCLYEGVLYVSSGETLYLVNPDSGERFVLLDVREVFGDEYDGIAEPKLLNGVFTFYLTRVAPPPDTEEGLLLYHDNKPLSVDEDDDYALYYFMLDGSMKRPELLNGTGVPQYNDGYSIIMRGQHDAADNWILYTWNPITNTSTQFADVTTAMSSLYGPWINTPDQSTESPFQSEFVALPMESTSVGYWGTDCAFYLEQERNSVKVIDNILCRLNYASGKSEKLLSTGLEGTYMLSCFPDCFVLTETVNSKRQIPTAPMMYIYSWEMELLGYCELNYPRLVAPQYMICSETANRIYLSAYFNGVPEYYIDKTELDGGTISYRGLSYSNIDPAAAYQEIYDGILAYNEEMARAAEAYGWGDPDSN